MPFCSSPIILPAALKRRSTPAEVIFYKYFYKYIDIYLNNFTYLYQKHIFLAELVRRRKVYISRLRFESSPKKLRVQKFECLKGRLPQYCCFRAKIVFGKEKCGRTDIFYQKIQVKMTSKKIRFFYKYNLGFPIFHVLLLGTRVWPSHRPDPYKLGIMLRLF